MSDQDREFRLCVVEVISRFCAQNARPAPSSPELERLADRLRVLVNERGLPRALRDDERGAPGGMSEEESAPLVARVLDGCDDPLVVEAARQLVKACFYPEFKICRDSFREETKDGSCRRQELERVRRRISGSHCVDCPHWVSLAPEEHDDFLVGEWRGDSQVYVTNREIFLPEDFRRLRRWLHAAARRSNARNT